MNVYDRIINILLEARVEMFIEDRLDEKRGDASARALAGARKAHADLAARTGRETTHNAFEDKPVPERGSHQAQELADTVKRAKTVIKHGPYSGEMSNTNKKINAHREKNPIKYPTTTSDRHRGESGYRGPRKRKTTQSGMYFKHPVTGKDVEI